MGVGKRSCRGAGIVTRRPNPCPIARRRLRVGAAAMQQSSIHPALAEALAARGYDTLTSVQTAAAAEEAQGRDLIVSAKTGSGKTVAFGLAIVGQILEGDRAPWT